MTLLVVQFLDFWHADILCKMGMVDQLVGLLQENHSSFHEHLMSALLTIVQDHPQAMQECQKTELNLRNTLTDRLELLKDKEEFQVRTDLSLEITIFYSWLKIVQLLSKGSYMTPP